MDAKLIFASEATFCFFFLVWIVSLSSFVFVCHASTLSEPQYQKDQASGSVDTSHA